MVAPPHASSSCASAGCTILSFRQRPFGRDRGGMGQELIGDRRLFFVPRGAHRCLAAFGGKGAIAEGEFLHLAHVVGEALGRGVDRGQAAADDHDGHADLQIGDGGKFRGAGQLQRHQEVAGRADAACEAVRHIHDRRLAGAEAERDVVETHVPRIVDRECGAAAEAHAAEMGEFFPSFQQQADKFEIVLVPADGDAVLGHAAETGHDAIIEIFDIVFPISRIGSLGSKPSGSIFNPSIATTVWPSFMRWCARVKPAGPRPTIRTLPVGIAAGRAADVERIPAREQGINFETPRQRQHILQHGGFGLRNVDRLLLLKMQAFMQSLQMRCPVAAIIGLSTAIAAKAPSRSSPARAARASR